MRKYAVLVLVLITYAASKIQYFLRVLLCVFFWEVCEVLYKLTEAVIVFCRVFFSSSLRQSVLTIDRLVQTLVPKKSCGVVVV